MRLQANQIKFVVCWACLCTWLPGLRADDLISAQSSFRQPTAEAVLTEGMDEYGGPMCCPAGDAVGCCAPRGAFFGGADLLLVRPHFSEAVAFAPGVQTPGSLQTAAANLEFDYDASWRAFAGYGLGCRHAVRFTYWNMDGETERDGIVGGPGQFIVDPFGGLVGSVVIMDPRDARGIGTVLTGGDRIDTQSHVELDIYDLDFSWQFTDCCAAWQLTCDAGLRIVDVDQFYASTISAAGAVVSRGDFFANFEGAGPRIGMELRRRANCLSAYVSGHSALLLGDYETGFSFSPVPVFVASQVQSATRLVPVLESEAGLSWAVSDRLTFHAGWLFQAWFDLGASGGTFGGLFHGADDANIMSFDGLILRAVASY